MKTTEIYAHAAEIGNERGVRFPLDNWGGAEGILAVTGDAAALGQSGTPKTLALASSMKTIEPFGKEMSRLGFRLACSGFPDQALRTGINPGASRTLRRPLPPAAWQNATHPACSTRASPATNPELIRELAEKLDSKLRR